MGKKVVVIIFFVLLRKIVMDGRGENLLNLIFVVFVLFFCDVINYGLIRKFLLCCVLCWCLNVFFLMIFLWLIRLKKCMYLN